MKQNLFKKLCVVAGLIGLAIATFGSGPLQAQDFLLRLMQLVLIDFGRAAVWPMAIVGLAYVLRVHIAMLVRWWTRT
jgi:hypothetical protein